jgi:flagellar hook-associated protein 2
MSTVSSTSSTSSTASTTSSSSSSSTSSSSSAASSIISSLTNIDWDALIEAAVAAKEVPADTIDVKITANEAKIAAYQEMQSLLSDLADAAFVLSGPTGTSNASKDVFNQRTAYLSSDGDTVASSAVAVSVDDGTELSSFTLQVSQLAKAQKVASTTQDSKTDALGYEGVFSVQLGDGTSADITVDSDMSLADIAQAINDESDTTNVKASVLQVTDSSYRLVIYGSETGQEMSLSSVSGDDVLTSIGVLDSAGDYVDELQAAQDAVFTYDGIEITRSTNEVDDLVDGVTIDLYETTGEDTITVEIDNDADTIKSSISDLVDAYNAYRQWAATQQETSTSGTASADAVLFGDGTLRNVNSELYSSLSRIIDENSMALVGLSYDTSNNLELDEDTLDDALLNNLDEVQALFTFQMTSSSSDLKLLAHDNNASASFTLDVTVDDDGNLTAASVDGDTSLFTVSGARVKGVAGTAYEGLSFVYTGDSSASISVDLTNGIAEGLYSYAYGASNSTDGTLETIVDNMTDQDDNLQTKSDDIRSRAEAYGEVLSVRYAKYQAAIAEASNSLSYLTALLDSSSSN